jgi:hypothetical protein
VVFVYKCQDELFCIHDVLSTYEVLSPCESINVIHGEQRGD